MKPQEAIYIPTGSNAIVLGEIDEQNVLIFTDNKKITVLKSDISFKEELPLLLLDQFRHSLFTKLLKGGFTDILYSLHSGKLIPEPHQYKPLIKFINSPNNRLLIADEVGLGKTIEAGMIYAELSKRENLAISIVVAPPSLLHKWKDELFFRFGETFEIFDAKKFLHLLDEYDRYQDAKSFDKRIIISYNTLRSDKVIAKMSASSLSVDFLGMDEAHTFRNADTSTHEAVEILCQKASSILFLSATPVQNRQEDLFNILSILEPEYFMDYEYFSDSIRPNRIIHKIVAMLKNQHTLSEIQEALKESGYKKICSKTQAEILDGLLLLKNLERKDRVRFSDELAASDHLSFIINRTKKKDVGRQIPRKASSKTITPTDPEREYYLEVVEFVKLLFRLKNPAMQTGFITIMPERMASSSIQASVESFRQMRKSKKLFASNLVEDDEEAADISIELQEMALKRLDSAIAKGELVGDKDTKLQELENVISELANRGIKKMIIFSFFKRTIDYLHEKLSKAGLKVQKMHGSNTPDERYEIVDSFRKDEFDILISSEVGSEGLDMQFCNVVINYDMPWNPMRVEQRIGRIDRIGQKADMLLIFNLCLDGSIEDRIYRRLYEKLGIFESSIGELEPILGDMSSSLDMEELLLLSDEERDRIVNTQADAALRKSNEAKSHSVQMEQMLSNDFLESREKECLDEKKEQFFKDESKRAISEFLKQKNISFTQKDGIVKLSESDAKDLREALRSYLCDRGEHSYLKQRNFLTRLGAKTNKFSFFENSLENGCENISLTHPLLEMIRKSSAFDKDICTLASHPTLKNQTLELYRYEISGYKKSVRLLGILENGDEVDEPISLIMECKGASQGEVTNSDYLPNQKAALKIRDRLLEEAKAQNERYIDAKIESIRAYYAKKIAKADRESGTSEANIRKMKEGEAANLRKSEAEKIDELERAKNVSVVFELVGAVKFV